jgi:molecular chaperone Hsp33
MERIAPARIHRALTTDTHIRFAALDARALWNGVRMGHPHLEPEACAHLVELLSAALLLQSRTFFSERLQLLLKGSGRGKALVADSWPDGGIRGALDMASTPDPAPVPLSEAPRDPWIMPPGTLQVMRSNPRGQPYIGAQELVEGAIQAQIEAYLQQSEQIQASISLWCDPATGDAGGILLEPLPQCPPERLATLVDAIEGLEVVPFWERDAEFLCRWFDQGGQAQLLATTEIEYRCRCSKASLLETLSGFGPDKLDEIFREGSPVEVRCDYCGKAFALDRTEIPAGTSHD